MIPEKPDEFCIEINKDNILRDSIYEVPETSEYLCIGNELHGTIFIHDDKNIRILRLGITDCEEAIDQMRKINNFIKRHKNIYIGSAYQCPAIFLFSEKPISLYREDTNFEHIGSDFNHGSSNLLLNCPKRMLILAEDD